MMEQELRQLLKDHGWSLYKRTRSNKVYLYALKWKKGEIYIAPLSKLPNLTKEEVLAKIS